MDINVNYQFKPLLCPCHYKLVFSYPICIFKHTFQRTGSQVCEATHRTLIKVSASIIEYVCKLCFLLTLLSVRQNA